MCYAQTVTWGQLAAEIDAAMAPAVPAVPERGLSHMMDQRVLWQETGSSPTEAMSLPSVFAVVRLIASSIDQLAVTVRGTSDPSWLYFPRREGGHLDLGDLIQHVVTSMCLHGAGYLQVIRKTDDSWRLDALHPDSVTVQKSSGGIVQLEYRVNGQAMERLPAKREDQAKLRPYLLAVPYLVTPQHEEGTSPIKDVWRVMAGYMKAEQQAAYLLDGMHSGGILSTDHDLTPETAKRWQDTFVENKAFGRPMVLGGGLTYQNVNPDPEAASWLPSRLYNAQVVASLYGVPPDMLGMTMAGGSSSLSYSNAQDNSRRFRANCLAAFTSQIEDAFSLLLGPGRNVAEARNFRFDWTGWEGAADADTANQTGPVADPAE